MSNAKRSYYVQYEIVDETELPPIIHKSTIEAPSIVSLKEALVEKEGRDVKVILAHAKEVPSAKPEKKRSMFASIVLINLGLVSFIMVLIRTFGWAM